MVRAIVIDALPQSFLKCLDLLLSFFNALLHKDFVVFSGIGPETFRHQDESDIGHVKGFLPTCQPGPSLFIGMVEIGDGNTHSFTHFIKMMMVKLAHFAAFILGAFEKLVLAKLKGPFIE